MSQLSPIDHENFHWSSIHSMQYSQAVVHTRHAHTTNPANKNWWQSGLTVCPFDFIFNFLFLHFWRTEFFVVLALYCVCNCNHFHDSQYIAYIFVLVNCHPMCNWNHIETAQSREPTKHKSKKKENQKKTKNRTKWKERKKKVEKFKLRWELN